MVLLFASHRGFRRRAPLVVGILLMGLTANERGGVPSWCASTIGRPSYLGIARCWGCHRRQYESWKKTKMAQAYETLKPGFLGEAKRRAGFDPTVDYTRDPFCLSCHTTGYSEPSGFRTIEETPQLAGVSCEACHGPGRQYWELMLKNPRFRRAEAIAAGLVHPGETVCVRCHNNRNPFAPKGEGFNYREMVQRGVHDHFAPKFVHEP